MEDGKGNWINRKRFGCFVLRFSPPSPPVKRTLDQKKPMETEMWESCGRRGMRDIQTPQEDLDCRAKEQVLFVCLFLGKTPSLCFSVLKVSTDIFSSSLIISLSMLFLLLDPSKAFFISVTVFFNF